MDQNILTARSSHLSPTQRMHISMWELLALLILGPNHRIMVAPIWDAMDQNSLSCGPRCNRIYIFNFLGSGGVDGYGDFFNCTVTISGVRNADPAQKAHQLPDDIAYIIAGSAGSEGWKDSSGRQSSKYSPT